MSDVLTYKGYSAKIEFDAADRIFFGRLAGIEDGVGFHADTVDGLIDAFHEAVDDYQETCAKLGKDPEKAYSGKLMLRVEPVLHAKLAAAAELSGLSLNQFGEAALAEAVQRNITNRVATHMQKAKAGQSRL
jgi:predicted HicB family RNase H-like nuclease